MEICCFGDSHTRYFKKSNLLKWTGFLTSTSPKIIAFDYIAASAKGFAAGAKSRFTHKKFMTDLTARNPSFVCLAYGQVDAEVGFYYRQFVTEKSSSAEADLSAVFDAYVVTAKQALAGRRVVFKGLNPSTLRDDISLQEYVYRRTTKDISDKNLRQTIKDRIEASGLNSKDHGEINCIANDLLKERVEKAGMGFFDIRASTEDPTTPGLASWAYIPADMDVHLVDSCEVRVAYQSELFERIQLAEQA